MAEARRAQTGGELDLRTLGLGVLFGGGSLLIGLWMLTGMIGDRRRGE